MKVYIASEIKDEKLYTALSFYNKIYKMEAPYKGEETRIDVLNKAMSKTEQWLKHHPGIGGKLIKGGLTFDTNLLSETYHGTSEKAFSKEIYERVCSLNQELNVKAEITNLEIDRVKTNLMNRAFYPSKDTSYHFKPNDLIISNKDKNDINGFSVFARVVAADQKTNFLHIDRYTDYGKISWKQKTQPLLNMELNQFYRPMTDDEVLMFCEGLSGLATDPIKSRCIDDKNVFSETYFIVIDRAEKIEQERKTKEMDV